MMIVGELRADNSCCEKTGLWGFRPGPTQTGLYNQRRWLEAWTDLGSRGIVLSV